MKNKCRKALAYSMNLRAIVVLLVSSLAMFFSTASVADWEINPEIRFGGETDDNANIDPRTDQEVRLEGLLVEASVDLVYSSNLTSFTVTPRYLHRSYSDEPTFDSDDWFVVSRYNYQMQNSSIGFWGRFDQQQVRTAEREDADLETEDPDEVPDDASGRVGLTGKRDKWRFVPNWNLELSSVSSFVASFDYVDVSYNDVLADTLTDYSDSRLRLSYRRAMSDRNTLVITASGRTYQSDDPNVEDIDGVSGLVGIERRMSETTRIRANVGVENTERTAGDKEPEVVGDLTLTRYLETITMFAQYRRSVNATGAGRVTLRDQVSVNFTRRLNEKISIGLGVRAYQTRGVGDAQSNFLEQEYVQLRTQFVWYLNQTFSVEADYRYTVLDRGDAFDGRANSNHVNLWFVFSPN
jgi:hypothetical protein